MTDKNGGESHGNILGDVWLMMNGSGFRNGLWQTRVLQSLHCSPSFDLGGPKIDLIVDVKSGDNMLDH